MHIDNNTIESVTYVDLNLRYDLAAGEGTLELYGNVQNLLDEDPPISANFGYFFANASQTNTFYDLIGRRYTLGARFSFQVERQPRSTLRGWRDQKESAASGSRLLRSRVGSRAGAASTFARPKTLRQWSPACEALPEQVCPARLQLRLRIGERSGEAAPGGAASPFWC